MKREFSTQTGTVTSFINGEYVSSAGSLKDKVNPTTGGLAYQYEEAGPAELEQAVESCREAQVQWMEKTLAERCDVMLNISRVLKERNEELSMFESIDTGKAITECLYSDIVSAQTCFDYCGKMAHNLTGTANELWDGSWGYTRYEPIGICAGIGAWNYPIQSAGFKGAPAAAAGNAMIMKPAQDTPMTALKLAEIFIECGAPKGLYNVLLGGPSAGQMLVDSPDIGKISFTGSRAVGKKIAAGSAQTLKKVTLELGGKSPLIIFDDCDLKQAVSGAMMANWFSNGEVCSNAARVFVQRTIFEDFKAQLLERTKKIKIGDPQNPESEMGPIINQSQYNKILGYINLGIDEGAKCILDGRIENLNLHQNLQNGYFIGPTIFEECTDEMRICQEEIFGPVMTLLPFDTEEEVLRRANDTPYGLAAGVFTQNLNRAHRVSKQFKAGVCYINCYNLAPVEFPWGGYKESGIGRENGPDVLKGWSELKTVLVEMNDCFCPYQ